MRSVVIPVMLAAAALAGCETISQQACASGDWEGIGFRDGTHGHSRARLADIAESCGKYAITPDRSAYLRGLEDGLIRYCTPERGYRSGRAGSGVNNECTVRGFDGYVLAHADGFAEHRIESEYRGLIQRWEKTDAALLNVTGRLADPELPASERERLQKKQARLRRRAKSIRIDIRAMERIHGFARWRPESRRA